MRFVVDPETAMTEMLDTYEARFVIPQGMACFSCNSVALSRGDSFVEVRQRANTNANTYTNTKYACDTAGTTACAT